MNAMGAARRVTSIALRTALLLALAIALAGPNLVREHDQLTVIGVVDVSGSIRRFADVPAINENQSAEQRRSNIEKLHQWLTQAVETRQPRDQVGLIAFDGEAVAVAAPRDDDLADVSLDISIMEGTNIEQAVRLGLALFPPDTARRLALVSDGNETAGSALNAARQAAGVDVPIDVLPISYRIDRDVQIASVETPPVARADQRITVRIVLEAARETIGRLALRHENRSIDLNDEKPGTARHVTLPKGKSVHLAEVELRETPVNRFEAIFEPDDPNADALPSNNRAQAFTTTPNKGEVLVLDRRSGEQSVGLIETLERADIPSRVIPPGNFPGDLMSLQQFDAIVLNNIAAYDLSAQQHELISRYVNDLGGGLIMLGGNRSFGAGGWNNTAVEEVLPLGLDPPKELRLPTAALVLVLDKSGSMRRPVAGARASQQQVANEGAALAIESLRSESYVGVVTFDSDSEITVPLQRNDDPKAIADRVRRISADGGTNVRPALQQARAMLRGVDVEKKRVVLLSDGRSSNRDVQSLVNNMTAEGIRISTIAVGNEADRELLEIIAEWGQGESYVVRNPRILPRVLVDSVQVINTPLIKEGPFTPRVQATGATLTAGMTEAPPLGGLVITAPRPTAQATIDLTHPDGEPLLARWQAGLGRVAAFTSDLDGRWSRRWRDWPVAETFWTQLVRTVARPPMNRQAELMTSIEGQQMHIALDATSEQGNMLDYLNVKGTVYDPSGESRSVTLQQTGPGRYSTTVAAPKAGNYIVALVPKQGNQTLAPVIGGATQTTGAEFRRYESDVGLLEDVARITGGRVLNLSDPAEVNLFDRSNMQISVSLQPIWRNVVLVLIGLFLLDVASRRIAWSGQAIAQAVARAIGRTPQAEAQRGAQSAATLASLQRINAQVENRMAVDAERQAAQQLKQKRDERERGEPQPTKPVAVNEPTPSRIAAALATLRGGKKEPQQPAESAQSTESEPVEREQTQKSEPRDPSEASSETTSGLLAAKRRAREQYRDDASDRQ